MVDVRRLFSSCVAIATIGSTTLLCFAVGSETKARDFQSVAVWTEIANQTTEIAPTDNATSDRKLPKEWLILGIALATTIAMVMLFILFKPDKTSETSDRDSESSET